MDTVRILAAGGCCCTEPWSEYSDYELQARDTALCNAPGCLGYHPVVREEEKPSLIQHYEDRERAMRASLESPTLPTEAKGKKDFDGTIDGAGYKASFDDPSKPPLSLVTRTFIWAVARVLGLGAKKYSRGNWMRGMSYTGTIDGVMRHITAWQSGETYDPETGQNHLAHAACGLMFLLTFQEGPRKDEYERFDDRIEEFPATTMEDYELAKVVEDNA